MKKTIEALGIAIFLLLSFSAIGQTNYVQSSSLQNAERYIVSPSDSSFIFSPGHRFSALVIKSKIEGRFSVVLNSEVVIIPKDEDVDGPTYFISLPASRQQIELIVPQNISFDLFSIQSGSTPNIRSRKAREELILECNDPIEYVPQSTWREGLPEPEYTRSFHRVFHNIVHHSAGSNTNTNYTQVVRDIYIYHTQVNGWSDIGYNYLIGQDGTIFAGRDPGTGSLDRVRGAHFCGANTGTLGVCLLGNFESATPTSEAWLSLESLLTFQLINQELDPFASFSHPLGRLGVIAGHREGCSTLCPGINVFSRLQNLRVSLASRIEYCESGLPKLSFQADTLVGVDETIVFQNTSQGYESYRWVLEGAFPQWINTHDAQSSYSTPGFYDVMLIGKRETTTDTLIASDFIQVSLLKDEPVIFPNPAQNQSLISVDFKEEIQRIELVSLNGRLVREWKDVAGEIKLPEIQSGIYYLNVISGNKSHPSKLILK